MTRVVEAMKQEMTMECTQQQQPPYGGMMAWSDVKWRDKVKSWSRRVFRRPVIPGTKPMTLTKLRQVEGERRAEKVIAAASLLYDNRIGEVEYTHDRNPYAPRAFWGALGLALGEDVSWIVHTARGEDDGRLTLRAAHQLLDYALAPKENKTAIDRLACDL